jgi:hypothetical protein
MHSQDLASQAWCTKPKGYQQSKKKIIYVSNQTKTFLNLEKYVITVIIKTELRDI